MRGKKKKSLINQLLTSMKHKDKTIKQHLSIKDVNSSSSNRNKLTESNELRTDELKVKTKNKKNVLKKLKNPSEETIFSTLSQNIAKQGNSLHIKTQPPADESTTDDEIDFIKQILENRKLNQSNVPQLIKKTDEPESSMKISTPTKLNKQKETSETINKESIPQNESMITTNEMNSDIIKTKKRTKVTKNLLVDSILNAPKIITNEVNSEIKTKKKKVKDIKDFPVDSVLNALTTANEVNSDIKNKKKKARETKDLLVDYMLNTSTVKTNEINSDTTKSKKKRSKESKDLLIDSVLNTSTITTNKTNSDILKRKKKKSKDLLLESVLNPMAIIANERNSNILKTKNKRPRETKNFIIDSVLNAPTVTTNEVNSDIKTKKKKTTETKDLLVDSILNVSKIATNEMYSDTIKTKKKRSNESKDLLVDDRVHTSLITTNAINSNILKRKKKKSKNVFVNNVINALTITTNETNSDILKTKNKRPKETTDSLIDSVPNFTEDTLSNHPIHAKKKKKEKSLIERNYLSEDKISDGNVIEVKKKKKKKAKHIDDTNLNDLNVKDCQKQYILPNLQSKATKKDQSTDVSKRKEKKKKVKRLKCDPIHSDGPSKINDDHDKNEKMKRKNKKRPNILTQSQLKDIVSSQDKDFLLNLDALYSSLK